MNVALSSFILTNNFYKIAGSPLPTSKLQSLLDGVLSSYELFTQVLLRWLLQKFFQNRTSLKHVIGHSK